MSSSTVKATIDRFDQACGWLGPLLIVCGLFIVFFGGLLIHRQLIYLDTLRSHAAFVTKCIDSNADGHQWTVEVVGEELVCVPYLTGRSE